MSTSDPAPPAEAPRLPDTPSAPDPPPPSQLAAALARARDTHDPRAIAEYLQLRRNR